MSLRANALLAAALLLIGSAGCNRTQAAGTSAVCGPTPGGSNENSAEKIDVVGIRLGMSPQEVRGILKCQGYMVFDGFSAFERTLPATNNGYHPLGGIRAFKKDSDHDAQTSPDKVTVGFLGPRGNERVAYVGRNVFLSPQEEPSLQSERDSFVSKYGAPTDGFALGNGDVSTTASWVYNPDRGRKGPSDDGYTQCVNNIRGAAPTEAFHMDTNCGVTMTSFFDLDTSGNSPMVRQFNLFLIDQAKSSSDFQNEVELFKAQNTPSGKLPTL